MRLKETLTTLKEVRRVATMETANFQDIGEGPEVNTLIKARTRLWRDLWILGPLDRVIEHLQNDIHRLLLKGMT